MTFDYVDSLNPPGGAVNIPASVSTAAWWQCNSRNFDSEAVFTEGRMKPATTLGRKTKFAQSLQLSGLFVTKQF